MSTRHNVSFTQVLQGIDELGSVILRKDLSGGQNSRVDPQNLPETQVKQLTNCDIGTPGQVRAMPGTTEIDSITGVDGCFTLLGFEPDGGTNSLMGVFISGTDSKIMSWSGTGDFSLISSSENLVTTSGAVALKLFKTGGDGHVSVFGSPTTNWFEIEQSGTINDLGNTSGTGSDSPPRSNVGAFYQNRFWVLVDNRLYYSDALPSNYATSFNTAASGQWYNMAVGEERFLIGIRGKGLICGGKDLIRYVVPGETPAATDENGVLVNIGCEAGNTAKLVGDDILYVAKDGVRGIFKTQYDTLQYGSSLPISYQLKDDFDLINWAHIDKACAIDFDNKYFLALPINSSTYNNVLWIYYPATKGWVTASGINVGAFSTLKINGQDRLYATSPTDGSVRRLWSGSQFDATDITITEVGRYEDMGSQLTKKTGGELHFKVKAAGEYTVNFYLSLDESDYNKVGELTTESRLVNFDSWTLPMIFQDAGTYVKRINFNSSGRWYNAQYKITCSGAVGDDLIILERGIRAITEQYLPNEES